MTTVTAPEIAAAIKAARGHALATLIRILGDYDRAEDVLQEALVRALETWPRDGLPDKPVAWLVTTARNRAIDEIRRGTLERDRAHLASPLRLVEPRIDEDPTTDAASRAHLDDDLLRLLFTCCHPVLRPDQQVLLSLKLLLGFDHAMLGRALLASRATVDQRLVRAKRALAASGVGYEVPKRYELAERLQGVLETLYLIFNEGYRTTDEPDLLRSGLCHEAIRLVRTVERSFRDEPEVLGLLALMLLHASRMTSRIDEAGEFVPLEAQDRSRWNRGYIREGKLLVHKAIRRATLGPYQIQAAISLVHCEAPSFDQTPWAYIDDLYALLEVAEPSPVVSLNRAVALAYAGRHDDARSRWEQVAGDARLRDYAPFHLASAEIHYRGGRRKEAEMALACGIELIRHDVERRYLERKLAGWRAESSPLDIGGKA